MSERKEPTVPDGEDAARTDAPRVVLMDDRETAFPPQPAQTQALARLPLSPSTSMDVLRQLVDPAALKLQTEMSEAYDRTCRALLSSNDVQEVEGKTFKKKSAWRKLARAFQVSTEIVELRAWREVDDGTEHLVAECRIRATAPWGQTMESVGVCSTRESRFYSRGVPCPDCGGPTWDNRNPGPNAPDWKRQLPPFTCKDKGCGGAIHDPDQETERRPNPAARAKADHDIRATAETRAKNRAVSDLIAAGEVSAEEVDQGEPPDAQLRSEQPPQAPRTRQKAKPTAKRKPTPKPNRPRGEVFYDTAKAAGLSQPDADEIAQDFLRGAFGVRPGQESEPQFSVLLEVLQGAGSLPPGYEVDPTLPEADQAAVNAWLEKERGKRRYSELKELLTEATAPNVLDWLAELYGLTTDNEALAVSPERWQAARIYAKADGHPIVLDEIGRRGDGDVDAGVEDLALDVLDVTAYADASALVEYLEAKAKEGA